MDLISKTVLVAVVIVVVIAVIYYAFEKVFVPGPVTEQQAAQLIVGYLQEHNPNAIVNVTNETPSTYQGSWHVVVSLISNPTTPCPTYVIYSFDYPKYGFVNRTDNVYTQNCQVSGLVGNSSYSIGAFPVAIVRSYNLRNSAITNFVNMNGYGNIVVHALYYPTITLNGFNYTKVWIVNYSATQTNGSVYAILSQVNGSFYSTYNGTH